MSSVSYRKIEIYRDGIWAGTGHLTDDNQIVDCSAVLAQDDDQEESEKTYESIEEAIDAGDDDVTRSDGTYTWEIERVDLVAGTPVEIDRSGVGHAWRAVETPLELPANIRMEIEGEILDGGNDSCGDFIASNGVHYRWGDLGAEDEPETRTVITFDRTYVDPAGYEHRYPQHVHGDDETIECAYCGVEVPGCPDCPNAPPADDDAAWTELAAEHGQDCEWIRTRAHRRGGASNERAAHGYATAHQGFNGTYEDWLALSKKDRAEFEAGAAGIPTA